MNESEELLNRKGVINPMEGLIMFLGIIIFYFAMQLWILPRFGIST